MDKREVVWFLWDKGVTWFSSHNIYNQKVNKKRLSSGLPSYLKPQQKKKKTFCHKVPTILIKHLPSRSKFSKWKITTHAFAILSRKLYTNKVIITEWIMDLLNWLNINMQNTIYEITKRSTLHCIFNLAACYTTQLKFFQCFLKGPKTLNRVLLTLLDIPVCILFS